MEERNIYALLVGIDAYKPPVPALAGCVNDMLAIKDFLAHRVAPSSLHMKVLMNEEATRMNIVEQFEQHLAQVGKDDTAFFYYSGHGAQEPAHEVFWNIEPDQKNETLVCYDSRLPDGMDLADKELGTLIEIVAEGGAHVVVIMDCCNSGSGTRNLADDPEAEFWPRQAPPSNLKRGLDSYILPRKTSFDRSAFISAEQPIRIPEARHVALTAAQSFQLAKETQLGGERRGVFTYSLLEVLQNMKGQLSYAEIMQRVHTLVTHRTFMQNPQLYAQQSADINLSFLGGNLIDKGEYFILMYTKEKGWFINGGAVHGLVGPQNSDSTTELAVFDEEVETRDMDPDSKIATAGIRELNTADSLVALKGGGNLDKDKTYKVKVLSTPVEPVKVCIRGDDKEGIRLAEAQLDQTPNSTYLETVNNSRKADLNLIAKSDMKKYTRQPGDPPTPGYVITRSTDRDDQPLVEQIRGFNTQNAKKAIGYLNHIARWQRMLALDNPGSGIEDNAIKIELFEPSDDDLIVPTKGIYAFSYKDHEGALALPQFRIRVRNTSSTKLYCVLLYFSSQFGIQNQLFGESGIWLDIGESAWAINGKVFSGKVSDNMVAFGRKKVHERFKLIVSTEEYVATDLQLPALDEPQPQLRSAKPEDTRSLIFESTTNRSPQDWNTQSLTIEIERLD